MEYVSKQETAAHHHHHHHGEGSVRHAEKRRAGTCHFANRVARASLDAYERCVPTSYRDANRHSTCIAAVVAHFRDDVASAADGSGHDGDDNGDSDNLRVLGLGAGTKFLPDAVLREERRDGYEHGYGKRIRDCHAEVLARRAFRRHLALEISSLLSGDADGCTDDGKASSSADRPILERVDCTNETDTDQGDGGGESRRANNRNDTEHQYRCRLRPNVTLHFYASSAPCEF